MYKSLCLSFTLRHIGTNVCPDTLYPTLQPTLGPSRSPLSGNQTHGPTLEPTLQPTAACSLYVYTGTDLTGTSVCLFINLLIQNQGIHGLFLNSMDPSL